MTHATRLDAHLVCDRCGHRERITDRTRFTECPCCAWPRAARDQHGRDVVAWTDGRGTIELIGRAA